MSVRLSILAGLLLMAATPCLAAGVLTYTPTPAIIGASPGSTVALVATLQNTGDATLYINDVTTTFSGPAALYFRRNPFFNFFNSVPGTFDATDSAFTGAVHEIVIAPGTPSGNYTVTIGIIGGAAPSLVDPSANGIGSQSFTIVVGAAQTIPYSVPLNGGMSMITQGAAGSVSVGFGSVQPFTGSTPTGLAIFGFRQNNVLVSEAGVPASPARLSGRIYAEVNGTVNTGISLANPNDQPALVSFYFTNATGDFRNGTTTIPAHGQISAFLDQSPFNGGAFISGSFTFNSSIPIAAIAIRGRINERGEFLMTTLPVATTALRAITAPLIFPHIVDGGGWKTEIILVNPADAPIAGIIQFFSQSGVATISSSYSIPPRSSQRFETAGTSSSTSAGWAEVFLAPNTAEPSGSAIFSYRNAGVIVTEAGVPDVPAANAFRLYAEASGTLGSGGSTQTGIAVVNTSATTATVTVELIRLDGTSTGLSGVLSVPANGQTAAFLGQIPGLGSLQLPSQGPPFQGLVRVSSSALISVTGLRGRYNERLDFLVTTTPAINEATPASTAPVYFPQIADSGGYTTQFVIFSGTAGGSGTGIMELYSQSGMPLNARVQ
jgi:hypothetical protein